MNESVCNIVSELFYETKLLSDPNIQSLIKSSMLYKELLNVKHSFSFYNLQSSENIVNKSFTNKEESEAIMHFMIKLSDRINKTQYVNLPSIGIISPYKEQVKLLNDSIQENSKLSKEIKQCIKIETVDSFQGQEEDIIVISSVRTKSLGFLIDYRRLNVAISRARYGCYLFGKSSLLSQDSYWEKIINYAKLRSSYIDYDESCLEYGRTNTFSAIK